MARVQRGKRKGSPGRHWMTKENGSLVPVPVEALIHTVRGQKVILDTDLARIYNVEIRRLNEQVKRNADRFPADFIFRLTHGRVGGCATFKVAKCDLKARTAPEIPSVCLHRARCFDGREHSKEQDRRCHEHLCCPRIRSYARGTHIAPRS